MFLHTSLEANVAEFDRFASGDGAAWQRQFDEFMAQRRPELRRPRDRAVVGGGARARRNGRCDASAAAASSSSRGTRSRRCRDWTTATFASRRRRTACSRRGCCTRASARRSAVSGFMTQVIACALQLGGMPVPVGGGVRLVDALAGIVRDAGGELRTGADVERILVADGGATGVALAGGETVAARARGRRRHTDAALRPAPRDGDAPAGGRGRSALRYGRAGMQIHLALDEPPRWKRRRRRAPRPRRDRPRHAGTRRRLARGQRGRARAPPGRGDDRRRPAVRRRSVACARRASRSSGSSCRSFPPAA